MELHDKWSHRWLTPKAQARRSEIHGLGVFAIEPIKKWEYVAMLGGVSVPKSEIQEYWNSMGHVGIQIDEEFFIVPTAREELEQKGVFNHSCDPNIGFSSSVTFVAMKNVAVGEELVFDYAFNESYHDGFVCQCGSSTCRKQISQEDWKLQNLQEKYREYFSPYLRKRFY